ncbi:hypothetical protein [Actinacidiphila glaucinigra]|uniref:Uncharacterized protein n=1 Tax=Actinacidiphila glaucinigra TaxID=235986 RepID=A0A239MQR8_9ACTN|nr:hypothetical protein [Actinacidiphila glaucinigra]SNT44464.1 hypothetical protein SAMN05216252_12620 [Actinacidiphila glaucinigra]
MSIAEVQVRDDMGDLADRIRAYRAIAVQREVRMPLGGSLFDTVITGMGDAAAMVATMDEIQVGACGPVIADPDAGWLYWLVPPGTTARWDPHPYGLCLGAPHILRLPPLARDVPPGPYWLRPCVSDRLLPPVPLRGLLECFRPLPAPHESIAAQLGFPLT